MLYGFSLLRNMTSMIAPATSRSSPLHAVQSSHYNNHKIDDMYIGTDAIVYNMKTDYLALAQFDEPVHQITLMLLLRNFCQQFVLIQCCHIFK